MNEIYLKGGSCLLLYIALEFYANLAVEGLSNRMCFCVEADVLNNIQIHNIPESLAEGSVIKKFNFTDVGEILLQAVYPPNITFDNLTQEFKIKKKFNITTSTPLLLDNITLTCTIIATGQEIKYKVLIEIYDENNNAPIFINMPYSIDVNEVTPQGSNLLPEISAVDADPSDAGKLTYSIKVTDEYSEYFNFTVPSSGKLTLTRELNFEFVKHINLSVQVKDNSYNESILGIPQVQHLAWTTVSINVVPMLGRILQSVNISYSLTVSDADRDIVIDPYFQNNPELELSLIADQLNDDWKFFQITNSNRLRAVTNQTKTQNILFLKVKLYQKSIFVVSFIFINIVKPTKFLIPAVSLILAENTLIGTFLAKLETTNPREVQKYYFVDKTEESEFFNLDQSSGIVTLKKDLRSIGKKEINLKIGVSDVSGSEISSDISQLRITISSIAESTPKFSESVYEFVPKNLTWIGQVQAVGVSLSIAISYRLIDQYRKFSIDQSGLITCMGCSSIGDSTLALVAVAEARTPYNRSDSALVIIHQPLSNSDDPSQSNWLVAFVISIVLAIILLVALIVFVALNCISSKKLNLIETDISQRCEPSESRNYEKTKGESALESIQKIFFSSKAGKERKDENAEVRSVSSDVPQMETSSMRILVHKDSTPSESSLERLGPRNNLSMVKRQERMDWTSSQDTINASNMTLTRPAVGTNGITLYY